MVKDWHVVKEEIEAELDRIWYEEPVEVTMSKKCIFPSGAGTMRKAFGNLFFLVCDTQAMGWWTCEPAMYQMFSDELFTLEHCKRAFRYMTMHMTKLMGYYDKDHNCPAPWMNLPKFWKFSNDIIDSYDSISTKEEFHDLVWSWENYVNRINRYFYVVFPWELGNGLDLRDPADFPEIEKLFNTFEEE